MNARPNLYHSRAFMSLTIVALLLLSGLADFQLSIRAVGETLAVQDETARMDADGFSDYESFSG